MKYMRNVARTKPTGFLSAIDNPNGIVLNSLIGKVGQVPRRQMQSIFYALNVQRFGLPDRDLEDLPYFTFMELKRRGQR